MGKPMGQFESTYWRIFGAIQELAGIEDDVLKRDAETMRTLRSIVQIVTHYKVHGINHVLIERERALKRRLTALVPVSCLEPPSEET